MASGGNYKKTAFSLIHDWIFREVQKWIVMKTWFYEVFEDISKMKWILKNQKDSIPYSLKNWKKNSSHWLKLQKKFFLFFQINFFPAPKPLFHKISSNLVLPEHFSIWKKFFHNWLWEFWKIKIFKKRAKLVNKQF